MGWNIGYDDTPKMDDQKSLQNASEGVVVPRHGPFDRLRASVRKQENLAAGNMITFLIEIKT